MVVLSTNQARRARGTVKQVTFCRTACCEIHPNHKPVEGRKELDSLQFYNKFLHIALKMWSPGLCNPTGVSTNVDAGSAWEPRGALAPWILLLLSGSLRVSMPDVRSPRTHLPRQFRIPDVSRAVAIQVRWRPRGKSRRRRYERIAGPSHAATDGNRVQHRQAFRVPANPEIVPSKWARDDPQRSLPPVQRGRVLVRFPVPNPWVQSLPGKYGLKHFRQLNIYNIFHASILENRRVKI